MTGSMFVCKQTYSNVTVGMLKQCKYIIPADLAEAVLRVTFKAICLPGAPGFSGLSHCGHVNGVLRGRVIQHACNPNSAQGCVRGALGWWRGKGKGRSQNGAVQHACNPTTTWHVGLVGGRGGRGSGGARRCLYGGKGRKLG